MYVIENPTIPSVHSIPGKLKAGIEIDVHGNSESELYRDFAFDLLSGPNIILHLNFRFESENHVVLNTLINESWGSEVRHNNPIKLHEPFHLRIYVLEGFYKIEVNNEKLAEFEHRLPVSTVQAIGIKGIVHVDSIVFKGFEFQKDKEDRHNTEHAITYAYEAQINAPSLVQIEGTQFY